SRGKSFTVFFYQPVQLPIKKENNFVFKIFAFLNIVCNVIFITFSLFISVIFLRKINRTYLLFLIPIIFLLLLFVFYFVLLENRELFCLLPMFILASSNTVKQVRLNFIPKKILYCVVSVIVLLLSVYGYYVGSLAY